MPAKWGESLGRNVNVRLRLYCIQHLHDARVPQRSKLAERIAGEG